MTRGNSDALNTSHAPTNPPPPPPHNQGYQPTGSNIAGQYGGSVDQYSTTQPARHNTSQTSPIGPDTHGNVASPWAPLPSQACYPVSQSSSSPHSQAHGGAQSPYAEISSAPGHHSGQPSTLSPNTHGNFQSPHTPAPSIGGYFGPNASSSPPSQAHGGVQSPYASIPGYSHTRANSSPVNTSSQGVSGNPQTMASPASLYPEASAYNSNFQYGGDGQTNTTSFQRPDIVPSHRSSSGGFGTYPQSSAPISPAQYQNPDQITRVPVGGRASNSVSPRGLGQPKEQMSNYVGERKGPSETSDSQDIENGDARGGDVDTTRSTPRIRVKGYLNLFSRGWSLRVYPSPHAYKKQGFVNTVEDKFRHQDSLGRVLKNHIDDRFLNPLDGRAKELIVQCTDPNWPYQHFDGEVHTKGRVYLDLLFWAAKWPLSCYVLNHVIGIPGLAGVGDVVNGGCYDPVPYRFWGYCKVTRNAVEASNRRSVPASGGNSADFENRAPEPKFLCFLDDKKHGIRMKVSDWKDDPANMHHNGKLPEYVLVAYTVEQFHHHNADDILALNSLAARAAEDAGVSAYWLGAHCLEAAGDGMSQSDLYLISDIIRGAHSVAIVVGTRSGRPEQYTSTRTLLQQWGTRLWTLPEALLATPNQPISVYRRDRDDVMVVPKRQFASLAWEDSMTTRQLIDHFEGNLVLSRLELVAIALESLFARETTQYFQGDHSYALMGLLRLRPKIDETDSAFQAFARLSLANDSDLLLERVMCILPLHPSQKWSSFDDAFGVKIWDIYPTCQIAGICEDDTFLVDGAFGATIHWDKFRKVANTRRVQSFTRTAIQIALHGAPYYMTIGLLLWRWAWDFRGFLNGLIDVIGDIPDSKRLSQTFWTVCFIPETNKSTTRVYCERYCIRGTQAWLFGFEGYADLETIETQIFGSKMNRLRWSTYGSSLSRHRRNEHHECVGEDPTIDPTIFQKVEDAADAEKLGDMKVFTLIDTNTMTVTLFEALRPPVCLLLCGTEGGMQRTIACSYQWTTGTYYRETILRLETPVLEKMSRVDRFRLGFKKI
ncbi:hypothetical protein BJ875DRAFT_488110 [Amylocarpus encephaloides]|uniref:Heterokaryon incompatibility domain-containing protein n=1 Tax=Amylocarpus encephaloides TaxID=45428 RepID=A0A9P7YAF7_9HELO|nr:hypothetical protein BJ875DRAFT_488110 [Amylocarpus encephaloides]